MNKIEQLLIYQNEDAKLRKIEREWANSTEYKLYKQANAFIERASQRLDQLEAKAVECNSRLATLTARHAELCEVLDDIDHVDDLTDNDAGLAFYKKNAAQTLDKIKSLKAEIESLKKIIAETSEEYQTLKKNTIANQNQRKENYEKFTALKESYKDTITQIKEKMSQLEKSIDATMLEKYKTKRKEKVFPILCELKGTRCSQCGTELSISGQDIIKSQGIIECERCLRIIYKKQ